MKQIFNIGDTKTYQVKVKEQDIAKFQNGVVHPVYSTFSISRDAEWTGRLFVLEMKDDDEEGIGTFIEVKHCSPALLGSEVVLKATIIKLEGNTINCKFEAKVGDRLIATGVVGQKILKKERIKQLFSQL